MKKLGGLGLKQKLPSGGECEMERPNVHGMGNLEAIIRDLHETEATLTRLSKPYKESLLLLNKRLEQSASEIVGQIKNEGELINVVNYLYWMLPDVKPASIARVLFGRPNIPKLMKMIRPHEADLRCEMCGRPVKFKSRTEVKEKQANLRRNRPWRRHPGDYILLCGLCRSENYARDEMKFEQGEAKRKERLKELRTMPYREYLRTPEWKRRRYYHLKSTGYHCQVCNAAAKQKRLNVHHRKYTTLGNESFTDLIVLCEDCHGLFHREGKLAKEHN